MSYRRTQRILPNAWNVLAAVLAGRASVADGLEPGSGLELDRRMGTWYGIECLGHSVGRDRTKVTAEQSKADAGSIRVVNRG